MHPQGSRLSLPTQEEIAALPKDGGEAYNRLIFASSPYLLQHATNPVDWYQWGPEAFAKAETENKPIFVSIGYATCHWCHVMAHESFEDEEVAEIINRHFVAIKIDKEERPDLDDIYMTACQAMTGQGGWPLTIFLDHEKRPFFAGTYFPKHSMPGRIGVMDLSRRIAEGWRTQRTRLETEAEKLKVHMEKISTNNPGPMSDYVTMNKAYEQMHQRYDDEFGGFGGAPKFPTPHNLMFLLRDGYRTGNKDAIKMVVHTLKAMRMGGVFDHVGHGIHRYSTDAHWLLPHFEKMLYDQALCAMAYLEAFQVSGDEELALAAKDIFGYVLNRMTDPAGGFYSAEDADSEGEEGKFYVWTPEEITKVLGKERGKRYCQLFNIVKGGNFADEATGIPTGDSIPHLTKSLDDYARDGGVDLGALRDSLEEDRKRLYNYREKRIHPLKDDKVLTDWNGLMIAALSMGGRILGDSKYTEAAARAARFLLTEMVDDDGRLFKRYRLGEKGLRAHLDDYAFLIWGLLELHQTTQDHAWLGDAVKLTEQAFEDFYDDKRGVFYLARDNAEELILRSAKIYDGAIPSGNSAMAVNLIRLFHLTGDPSHKEITSQIFEAFGAELGHYPSASCFLLCGLSLLLDGGSQLVFVGDRDGEELQSSLSELHRHFLPFLTILVKDPHETDQLSELAPFTKEMVVSQGAPTAFLCKGFSCQMPENNFNNILTNLLGNSP